MISTLAVTRAYDVVLPGDETEVDLLSSTIVLLSVDGVASTVMRRRPGIGLVSRLNAVHFRGRFDRRCKPRRASSRIVAQAGRDVAARET
jgi:hypothetical protein